MILLDTNVISELMREDPNESVVSWLDQQFETDLYLCAITKAEIECGIGLLDSGKRKLKLQKAAVATFEFFPKRCLAYSCDAASRYTEIVVYTRRIGRPMSVEDMMIAAVAQSDSALLVTRNIKDFDFLPDLQLLNPWDWRSK